MYIKSTCIIQFTKTWSDSRKVRMSATIYPKSPMMQTTTSTIKHSMGASRTTPLSLSPPLYLSSPSTSVRLQDELPALTKPLSHPFSLSSPFPSRDTKMQTLRCLRDFLSRSEMWTSKCATAPRNPRYPRLKKPSSRLANHDCRWCHPTMTASHDIQS